MKKNSAPKSAAQTSPKDRIRTYIAALPPDTRRQIRRLRSIILAAAHGTSEAFSYGIPAVRLDDKPLVWYAAWKEHLSLYPMSASARQLLARQLRGYETSKGTIRFPLGKPIPPLLVRRLVKARMAEIQMKGNRR